MSRIEDVSGTMLARLFRKLLFASAALLVALSGGPAMALRIIYDSPIFWEATTAYPTYASPMPLIFRRARDAQYPECGWALKDCHSHPTNDQHIICTRVLAPSPLPQCIGPNIELEARPRCPQGEIGVDGKFYCGHIETDSEPNEPKNRSCPEKDAQPPPCGNPINPGTGNKFQREVDFDAPYAGGLSFVRFYNSSAKGLQSELGANWTHNWSARVQKLAPDFVSLWRPDGKQFAFTLVNAAWQGDPDVSERLVQTANGWTVTTRSGDVEQYDSQGKWISVTNGAGQTTLFLYTDGTASGPAGGVFEDDPRALPSDLLLRVTDYRGRSIGFTYLLNGRIRSVTDPAGVRFQFAYEGNTNLAQVRYGNGNGARNYLYHEPGNAPASPTYYLTGIETIETVNGTDRPPRRFATYRYSDDGKAISTEHAGGAEKFTVTRNADNTVSVLDVALGAARTYSFAVKQGVVVQTGETQPCPGCAVGSTTATSQIDANGNITSRIDHNGALTCHAYDLSRNLEISRVEGLSSAGTCSNRVTTPATRTITTEWHPTWREPVRIAEPLRITTYVFHGDNNVSCAASQAARKLVCSRTVQATTDADGSAGIAATADGPSRAWLHTYNAAGQALTAQLLTVDGPRQTTQQLSTYSYAASGDPASITNAIGHVTQFTNYDSSGRLTRVVDANGLETLLDYWPRGWVKSRSVGTPAAGYEVTRYDYDVAGQMKKATLPDGSFLTYTYDDAQRLTDIQDGVGNSIHYDLDGRGNRTTERSYDPQGLLARKHGLVVDALNRPFRDIGGTIPATQITESRYDALGNVTSVLDPLGRETTHLYDSRSRLVETRDPFGGITAPTKYEYDGRDQLKRVIDPKGLATLYTVNGHGKTIAQSSPDTGLTTFTFDDALNLKTKADARGVQATYDYDGLNRATRIVYPDETVTYTYDTCANGIGRLCTIADGAATTSFAYDPWGRVTRKTQVVGAIMQAMAYAYNAAGQLSQVTTPGGQTVVYTYSNGRPVSVSVNGTTVLDSVLYEPFGPNGGWRWGNHTAGAPNYHTRVMDLDFRTTRVTSDLPAASGVHRFDRGFSWDDASRISATTDFATSALNGTYGYDALDRLTSASQATNSWGFTFDAVGNRLTSTANAATTTYGYAPGSHRLQSLSGAQVKSYSVDAAGNMTSDGAATWTYGGNNRPKQVTAGGITTRFAINALGQRVRKANATSGTRFVYDEAGRLWGEYSETGALISETIWLDDLPVAVVKAQPAAPVEQVIDNGSPGFMAAGTWTASTSTPGYLGANYLVHNPGADALGAVIVDNTDAGFTSTGGWTVSTSAPGYLGANYRVRAANGPPPSAFVADNSDASVTMVGTWPASTTVGGYHGANYQTHAAGTGADSFTWNVAVAETGTYEVYARWTAYPNRASNASYTVATAAGNQTVIVNQQVGSGQWTRLGTWSFAAGNVPITLSDAANGFVIADAVMLVPPGAAPSTATWSATLPTAGNWRVYARWAQHPNRATNAAFTVQTAGGAVPAIVNQQAGGGSWQLLGSYAFSGGAASVSVTDQGDGFVVADAVKFEAEGSAPESVTWTPALTAPARFDVYARWTAGTNRSASASYTITHQGGTSVVTQNQQANGATWNLLGTFTFAAGQGVKLTGSEGGYVIADAVKFTPAAEQPTTGGLFYVHADHLGTPRMITRPSDNAIMWRWDNAEPFGNSPANENPSGLGTFAYNLRFPGQYFDSETGKHYNYFRDYDPSIGRYVQSDPIGLGGGANTYAYVMGNPVRLVDPRGLQAFPRPRPPVPMPSPGAGGATGGDVIPFPGGRDRERPGRDRPGSCPAPNPDNDQPCTFTGLSTMEQIEPYSYTISCQYRCPRKGIKYIETRISFPSLNPSFLCSATAPESMFSWSGRY